jgi:ketosteroid isomerase-like protein
LSAENLEVVKRSLERFVETGEIDWALVDEEVEITDHDIPDQAGYHGHAGLARWLEDWGAAWADYTFEPTEFIEAGEYVVVVVQLRAKGRGSGLELDREDAIVYQVRDGKIIRTDYYNNTTQAFAAAGIAPSRE